MNQWPPQYPADYVPAEDSEYWSKQLETMPSRERDPIILDKLRRQISYAYTHSEFYRELYRDVPVDPNNIRSFEELAQLPILTKEHIRAEQEAHPPYGRFLCVSPDDVCRIHGTSGTTGRPTIFGISRGDWERIGEAPRPHFMERRPSAVGPGDGCGDIQPVHWQLGCAGRGRAPRGHLLSIRRRRARSNRAGGRVGSYGQANGVIRHALLCPLLG